MNIRVVLSITLVLIGVACSSSFKHVNGKVGIYHGKNTSISQYPFVVSVVLSPEDFLVGTGVVLNENWVLSTGYVASEFGYDRMTLRVGSGRWNAGGQTVRVEKTVLHPNYTGDWNYNVAVLKTTKPLKLGKKAKAASLGTEKLAAGTSGQVVGWGPPNEKEIAPTKHLQVAQNTVLDYDSCKKQYPDVYGDSIFCTRVEKAGPCSGDFGGPLVKNNTVYGLYTGADNCMTFPRIYTNVPDLAEWINKAIKS